jgi:serine protease Do
MKSNLFRILFIVIIFIGVGIIFSSLYSDNKSSAQANIIENFLKEIFPSSDDASREQIKPEIKRQIEDYISPIEYEEAIISAVEKNAPAVISIIVTKDLPIIENCRVDPLKNLPPEFREFFGSFDLNEPCEVGTRKQEIGGGSGFIVSSDGMIVTNKHVVNDKSASYTVLTNNGKRYDAKVLARDPVQDLAIVKINPENGPLPVVTLGNSDSIKLAQTAIAIGNSLGEFRNTVSVGIVSGLSRAINASDGGRNVERLEGLIQTDAAINPGNSGGPLLNLRGEVIAINTAVAQNAENIGFAIPINKAKRDIESVKITGKITTPFLGVRYRIITTDFAKEEKLPVEAGALIRGSADGPAIFPGSPAEGAGLKSGDIIIAFNNEKITRDNSLAAIIQKYNVGETINLKVLRDKKEIILSVTLTERNF